MTEDKKEKIKLYKKKYREANREHLRLKSKERYDTNKEYFEKYAKENKEKITEYKKEHYIKNKEKIKESSKKWANDNPDKVKELRKNWKKKKIDTDPFFKITYRFSNKIRKLLKKNGYTKSTKTIDILGCSLSEFKTHLESNFEDWMCWDNYGLYNGELNYGWDIDHIVPSSSANTEEEVVKLNHYTNLQPLCSYTNRVIKKNNL